MKGGEDLRVDQRVEQLFEVMNAVMGTSASCRRARLSNKTYKVGGYLIVRGFVKPQGAGARRFA